MGKNETDDAAIALKKEKERARIAAYRAAIALIYFELHAHGNTQDGQ